MMSERRIPKLGSWAPWLALLLVCLPGGPCEAGDDSPETWTEPLTGMEFVWVPDGCFMMGSPPEAEERSADEIPSHEVCLDGFWMGRTEVTREQFRRFVRETGYRTSAEQEGFSWVYGNRWERRRSRHWRNPGFEQDDSHPLVHVSWKDARAMARWLTEESKGRFALPTEAQWEYACRAGTRTSRFWGDDVDQACEYANLADKTARETYPAWVAHPCRDGFVHTAPAGRFAPNPFGLQDMLGNVWEWCEDGYRSDLYRQREPGVENPSNPVEGSGRVIRGGSWYSRPPFARCAGRDSLQSDRRGSDVGFRLVRKP